MEADDQGEVEVGQGEPGPSDDRRKIDLSSDDSETDSLEGEIEMVPEELEGEGVEMVSPWAEEEESFWHWNPLESVLEEIEEEHIEEETIKEWVCGQDWSKSTIGDLTEPIVSVGVERCGSIVSPRSGKQCNVHQFSLTDNIITVKIIDYGATIVSIQTPDKNGLLNDILLGLEKPEDYVNCSCLNFGATIGRTTGVINMGEFLMSGKDYYLNVNFGRHHKNGGCCNFGQVMWKSYVKNDRVIMSYMSKSGEEGYPGSVYVQRSFIIPGNGTLVIETQARVSLPTPLGISSMLYFNLAGHGAGEKALKAHIVQLNSDSILEEIEGVPTGSLTSVAGTGYDLRTPRKVSKALKREEYDTNFCLRPVSAGAKQFALRLAHADSGRFLEIETDHPAIFMNSCGKFPGKAIEYSSVGGFPKFSSYQDMAYLNDVSTLLGSVACPKTDVMPTPQPMPTRVAANEVTTKGKFWLTPTTKKDVFGHTDSTPCELEKEPVDGNGESNGELGESYDSMLGIPGKEGALYTQHCALAVMPCDFSGAANHKTFPSIFLKPDQMYTRVDVYRFGVIHQRPVASEVVIERTCPPRVETAEPSLEGADESSTCFYKESEEYEEKVEEPVSEPPSIPSVFPNAHCQPAESLLEEYSMSTQNKEENLEEEQADSQEQLSVITP